MASRFEHLRTLAELAKLTALDEGSPQAFRVRAYENAIQGIASTVTYLERYTFFAALGIASAEMFDDDGNYTKILTEVVTKADIKLIEKLLKESKADVPKFLDAFLIQSLDQLPKIKMAQATAVLNRKIKEASNDKG